MYLSSRPSALITGASGFIGQHLIRRLLARGCEIHGVSRREPEGYREGVWWHRGDVTDTDQFQKIVFTVRPERIIHLASLVSGDRSLDSVLPMLCNNLLSTVGVLVAASKTNCGRVILAGSMEEPNLGLATPAPVPGSPYAAAKWAASGYARMFHALYDLPVVMLRIFMTYGPGQGDATKLIPYVVQSLLRGEVPTLGSGKRAIDWIYVEDVAEGIERACFAKEVDGRTIDLGSGTLVPIKDMVNWLVAVIDPSIVPAFGAIPDRPLEQERFADTANTVALLDWRASTSLDVGLEQTVRWYKEHL